MQLRIMDRIRAVPDGLLKVSRLYKMFGLGRVAAYDYNFRVNFPAAQAALKQHGAKGVDLNEAVNAGVDGHRKDGHQRAGHSLCRRPVQREPVRFCKSLKVKRLVNRDKRAHLVRALKRTDPLSSRKYQQADCYSIQKDCEPSRHL